LSLWVYCQSLKLCEIIPGVAFEKHKPDTAINLARQVDNRVSPPGKSDRRGFKCNDIDIRLANSFQNGTNFLLIALLKRNDIEGH
jgi:hypothetical protein